MIKIDGRTCSLLMAGFGWAETAQGHCYWSKIFDNRSMPLEAARYIMSLPDECENNQARAILKTRVAALLAENPLHEYGRSFEYTPMIEDAAIFSQNRDAEFIKHVSSKMRIGDSITDVFNYLKEIYGSIFRNQEIADLMCEPHSDNIFDQIKMVLDEHLKEIHVTEKELEQYGEGVPKDIEELQATEADMPGIEAAKPPTTCLNPQVTHRFDDDVIARWGFTRD